MGAVMRSSGQSVDIGASSEDPRLPEHSPNASGFAVEARLLLELRGDDPRAREALVARYAGFVESVVASVLGVDGELADVVQDAFVQILVSVKSVREPGALKAWIARVAVFTAQSCLRRRRRRRWLHFMAPEDLPEVGVAAGQPAQEALRATYRVLARMPLEERSAFALRFIAELDLTETAAACGVSLATIKRRLVRAEARFLALAPREPALAARLATSEEEP